MNKAVLAPLAGGLAEAPDVVDWDRRHAGSVTLFEILESQAALQPDKVALRFVDRNLEDEESLTYRVLHQRAEEMARRLIADGLAGQRIIIGHETGPDFVIAFFAVMAAGGTVVPVASRLLLRPSSALDSLLGAIKPSAVLVDADVLGRRRLTHLPNRWTGCVDKQTNDSIEAAPLPQSGPALIQFTSGSTSRPRGVAISHGNFIANAQAISRAHRLSREDIAVSWLPLFHDMGLMLGIVWPVVTGASSILMRPSTFVSQPFAWLKAISRYGATVSSSPNFGYQACVDGVGDDELTELDLSRWRVAICGAEPIRPSTIERFTERFARCRLRPNALAPAYGLAEATVYVSGGSTVKPARIESFDAQLLQKNGLARAPERNASAPDSRRLVSCGRPADNLQIVIVDVDAMTSLPEGKVGEIWISGPSVADGYFEAAAANPSSFGAKLVDRHGSFLRSGDLGFMFGGELYVSGRIKDLIIVRGEKFHPHDIEATVRVADLQLGSAECTAFESQGEDGYLTVVVEHVPGNAATAPLASAIRAAVSSAHGLHVDIVCFVGRLRLPRTSSGKIRRHETRRLWEDGGLKPLAVDRSGAFEAIPNLGVSSTLGQVRQIWQTMLGIEYVDVDANFFELGGDSVRLAAALAKLKEIFDVPLALADLFEHPSVRALSSFIENGGESHRVSEARDRGKRRRSLLGKAAEDGIAVVGMSGRFPGAPDLEEFWASLKEGRVSIVPLSEDDERAQNGQDETPSTFVRAAAVLKDPDLFDAEHFGMGDIEAAAMDPQHRVLLECAHQALESAGCDPQRAGSIGVYVGSGMNPRRLSMLGPHLASADATERWLTILGNDKDYLASRIAYKLGLRGPSLTVQTACSTSLVAVHVGCQALLAGECDVAVAGGATVANSFAPEGYRIDAGDVASKDGHCRPFDTAASGTVFGDGAGIVVLKRAADAVADGDRIHAIILGSATNNDGSERVGYSAPSVAGQAAVMSEAWEAAGVDADAIGYIETHGSATPVGDLIETTALTRAFRAFSPRSPRCALGSVKANIGHASAAAGIAGLIKTILVLEHEEIPPNPEFTRAHPAIDFDGSPFSMEAAGRSWPRGSQPRIAGVSSFGMGGVNAHVVVTEVPSVVTASDQPPRDEIVLFSARTSIALEALTDGLASHFSSESKAPGDRRSLAVADAAYTFAAGRQTRLHRRAFVAAEAADAARILASRDSRRIRTGLAAYAPPPVVFMIPGSGSQCLGMGRTAYQREAVYRETFDRCADVFASILDLDLRKVLFETSVSPENTAALARPSVAQPAQFAVSCSLAALWASWGIKPAAIVGHSFGEVVAAHLAGVFTFETAAELIAIRARLVESTRPGAMLAVMAPRDTFEPMLGPDVTIACQNGPAAYTIAGDADVVSTLDAELTRRGILSRLLRTDRAYHSPSMKDIVEPFITVVRAKASRPPKIPFVSTVTGTWLGKGEATDPAHWGRQLIEPVRFADALATLAASNASVFLEVGPNRALSTFVEQNLGESESEPLSVASLPVADGSKREIEGLLLAAGALWTAGCSIDSNALGRPGSRKSTLPTHPLVGKRLKLTADDNHDFGSAPDLTIADLVLPQEDDACLVTNESETRLERTLVHLWRKGLGLQNIGLDDDFFEFGGHSLIAAGTARRIAATLGRPVGVTDLFRFPTPRKMAAYLSESAAPGLGLMEQDAATRAKSTG